MDNNNQRKKEDQFKKEKKRAKEAPRPRLILLFVMMALFITTPVMLSGFPIVCSVLLGIFCADLFYFLLVVLKVHTIAFDKSGLGKSRGKQLQQEAKEHAAETARKIAGEGFVLMKNEDNLLPLTTDQVNLIGLRGAQMCFNGGGSAASDESACIPLYKALPETGLGVNPDFIHLDYWYLKNGSFSVKDPGKNFKIKQGSKQKGGAEFVAKPGDPVKKEIPAEALTSKLLYSDGRSILEHAKEYSDTAVIVLSRGGGEGYELDPADLQLIESERQMLDKVCGSFDKVVLLLNMVNTLEMGWLADYPQIKSVLWIGFPGSCGNLAVGDILTGKVNPSGHLPDTWAYSNLSAPAANNYLQKEENGSFSKENFHYTNAPEKKGYFVNYSEGIYVGYRYFETRSAVDPAFDYAKEVFRPFGYGLSYTTFDQCITGLTEEKDQLILKVKVKNSGDCSGKAALQVYLKAPYTGKIEKSSISLLAFDKTELLQPGTSAGYEFAIPKKDMASFDEGTGKWTLEAGTYTLALGADAHELMAEIRWTLAEAILFEGSGKLFEDAGTDTLTRSFDPDHRAFTGPKTEDFTATDEILEALKVRVPKDQDLGLTGKDYPKMNQKHGLKLKDMTGIPKEDEKWDRFVEQLTFHELTSLCANGAWQTEGIARLGVPRTLAPDGPTSISATVFSTLVMGNNHKGITWTSPAVLAAAFHPALAEEMGDAVGREGHSMGYQGWYAPAMNCHRTQFNSRNFEYYSEDPLLAGKNAARVVAGAQKQKVIPYIKHFALNERETNARNQLFTWCSEQPMREIYLKPFELCVREGRALGVMSSFNYIGLDWAGGNRKLLTDLLRKEWGFKGAVVTDACLYPHMDVAQMLWAGGNLSLDTLGGFTGGNLKRRNMLAEAQDPQQRISMAIWLQRAAKDILYMVCQTL